MHKYNMLYTIKFIEHVLTLISSYYTKKGLPNMTVLQFFTFVKRTFAIRFRYLLMNAVALRSAFYRSESDALNDVS